MPFESDLAFELAEAIRRALIHEHYPGCKCARQLKNECDRRRLGEAFKRYAAIHPEHYPVF